jgi:hypothetical protein
MAATLGSPIVALDDFRLCAARVKASARSEDRAGIEADLPGLQAQFEKAVPEIVAELDRLSRAAGSAGALTPDNMPK